MFFHSLDPEPRQMISPCADDAWHQATVAQILNAFVRGIEVLGIDARIIGRPWKPAFTKPALIERRHVRVESGDNLHCIETFGDAVRCELLKLIPMQPSREPHPPGIGQPEKWRAIGVLQMTLIRRYFDRTVQAELVRSIVWRDNELRLPVMQRFVVCVRANRAQQMSAFFGR
jgi:hypothetical protein